MATRTKDARGEHDRRGADTAERVKIYARIARTAVIPNDWNPNVMPDAMYAKLKRGLQVALKKNKQLPPIIVRRHPEKPGTYQIIDGYHRWKALGELGQQQIGVWIIEADEAEARVFTSTMNWVRGSPDRKKYAASIVEMLEHGATPTDLAELLPESEDELAQLIEETDVSVEAFEALKAEDEDDEDAFSNDDGDPRVELKFSVFVAQAKVIEAELARISRALTGKDIRARAFEIMAVMSSQCDVEPHA